MSANKRKGLQRRLRLLAQAAGSKGYRSDGRGALRLHCEGGHAFDNPDIQRLLRDGHLGGMERRNWFGERRVKRFLKSNDHGAIGIRPVTTLLYLTPSGEEFFRRNRHLLRHELPYPLDRERYLWMDEKV